MIVEGLTRPNAHTEIRCDSCLHNNDDHVGDRYECVRDKCTCQAFRSQLPREVIEEARQRRLRGKPAL